MPDRRTVKVGPPPPPPPPPQGGGGGKKKRGSGGTYPTRPHTRGGGGWGGGVIGSSPWRMPDRRTVKVGPSPPAPLPQRGEGRKTKPRDSRYNTPTAREPGWDEVTARWPGRSASAR